MDNNKLVWAKLKNFPWWPGMVISEEKPKSVIQFFDEEQAEEYVSAENMRAYVEHKGKMYIAGLRQCKTAAAKQRFEEAVTKADKMLCPQGEQIQTNQRRRTLSAGAVCPPEELTSRRRRRSDISQTLRYPTHAGLSSKVEPERKETVHPVTPTPGNVSKRSVRLSDKCSKVNSSVKVEPSADVLKSEPKNVKQEAKSISEQSSSGAVKAQRSTKSNSLNKSQGSKNQNDPHSNLSTAADGGKNRKRSTSQSARLPLTESFKSPNTAIINNVTDPSKTPLSKHSKKKLILPTISPSQRSPKVMANSAILPPSPATDNKPKAPHPKRPRISDKRSRLNVDNEVKKAETEQTKVEICQDDVPSSPVAQSSQVDAPVDMDSADDDDDDELPSLEVKYQVASSDLATGSLVWVKLRKYPQWPGIVYKMNPKRNRAAIKFINADNLPHGLWVKKANLTEFPGNMFKQYEQEAIDHRTYSSAIQKAIRLVNLYLHEKCADPSLDPLTYFFPNRDGAISDVESLKSDEDMETETILSDSTSTVDLPPFRVHKFGDETLRLIQEREEWIVSLMKTIEEDSNIKAKLMAYVKNKGKTLKPLASRHNYLGPLAYSNSNQGVKLLNYVVSAYECVTQTIHLPDWCYTCVIPQVIICGIQKLDGLSYENAKEKYSMDMRTEEEDMHQHQQIINSSEQISDEEALHYQTILSASSP